MVGGGASSCGREWIDPVRLANSCFARKWRGRSAGTLRDLVTPIERKGLVGFVRKNPAVLGEESGSFDKIVHIHGRGWRLIVRPIVDQSGSFGKFVLRRAVEAGGSGSFGK